MHQTYYLHPDNVEEVANNTTYTADELRQMLEEAEVENRTVVIRVETHVGKRNGARTV